MKLMQERILKGDKRLYYMAVSVISFCIAGRKTKKKMTYSDLQLTRFKAPCFKLVCRKKNNK